MSVIVVGLNHRTAPVELRERVAVPVVALDKALHDLGVREHLAEVVLLSTCNRTEIYAALHASSTRRSSDVLDFLAEQASRRPRSSPSTCTRTTTTARSPTSSASPPASTR